MAGQLAMVGGTWPPIGRWSEGTTAEQLNWVPETQVAGKVGYSVMPMGHSLHNAGFILGVSADSQNKEAAYLFIQWVTSPTISLQRVMLPYALRDPYRLSHYASEEYRGTVGRSRRVPRHAQRGGRRRAARHRHAGLGRVPHRARPDGDGGARRARRSRRRSPTGNAAFNEITDRIGRDSQKAAYAELQSAEGGVLRVVSRKS